MPQISAADKEHAVDVHYCVAPDTIDERPLACCAEATARRQRPGSAPGGTGPPSGGTPITLIIVPPRGNRSVRGPKNRPKLPPGNPPKTAPHKPIFEDTDFADH